MPTNPSQHPLDRPGFIGGIPKSPAPTTHPLSKIWDHLFQGKQ